MEVREKLVEFLKTNACPSPFICDQACKYYGYGDCFPVRYADHLISNGVTVQEWIYVKDNTPTETRMNNADKIRSMTDDELNELFHDIYNAGAEDAAAYEWGQRTNSFEWTMDWLQKPAE